MRVPPALMWWEVKTVSPVPATLGTLEMVSPVWVSIQLIEVLLEILWMITQSISTHTICDCVYTCIMIIYNAVLYPT